MHLERISELAARERAQVAAQHCTNPLKHEKADGPLLQASMRRATPQARHERSRTLVATTFA